MLCLCAGLPLPGRVFGHGFLTSRGMKMGKALGNVIDPHVLVAGYGADAVRYYFMKEIRFGEVGGSASIQNPFLGPWALTLVKEFCSGEVGPFRARAMPLLPIREFVRSAGVCGRETIM